MPHTEKYGQRGLGSLTSTRFAYFWRPDTRSGTFVGLTIHGNKTFVLDVSCTASTLKRVAEIRRSHPACLRGLYIKG